ncbi:MAG: cation:proton antiporter [Acetobacteraceae bacterium]|nr:cation:proton antiporter [Acetobacteraceae bacterium]
MPMATFGILLLVASIVAVISRRLRLPYSVALVAAGIALAFLPVKIELQLTPALIFNVLLPPLIFEAAVQIPWAQFRRDLPVTLLLAILGVAISATIVALGVHALLGWAWIGAILFGILIGATDPVAVIAAFKELKVEPRLALLVEAESLLNDGTAAVGFSIALAVAGGAMLGPVAIAGMAGWTICGGLVIGAAVAAAMLLLAGRTDDHLVEITLTVIIAYGSFLIAEATHASGILAALAAGLVVGNRQKDNAVSRAPMLAFWEYAAFLANSIVFILIGLEVSQRAPAMFGAAAWVVIALVMVGRAVAVYALCLPFRQSRLAVQMRHQHVLVWGGLRGALALALALSLPVELEGRDTVIVAGFAVVAFSVFAQGLTMPALVRRLGLIRKEAE